MGKKQDYWSKGGVLRHSERPLLRVGTGYFLTPRRCGAAARPAWLVRDIVFASEVQASGGGHLPRAPGT